MAQCSNCLSNTSSLNRGIVPAPCEKRARVPLPEHLNLDLFAGIYPLKLFNSKLGHCEIQLRTLRVKYGQHLIPDENILTKGTKVEHYFQAHSKAAPCQPIQKASQRQNRIG
jgi:hypothetical protein